MSSVIRRNGFAGVCALGLLLFAPSGALAQSYIESPRSAFDGLTPKGLEPGAPAGSYVLSGFDSVNLYNGSLSLTIPLLRIGGRGEAGYTIQIPVSPKWNVTSELLENPPPGCGTPCYAWYFDTEWWANLDYAYRGAAIAARYTGADPYQACLPLSPDDYRYSVTLTRLTVRMPDGTEVELRDALTGGEFKSTGGLILCGEGGDSGGFNRGRVWVAADGSATTFISDTDIKDGTPAPSAVGKPSGVLFFRNGTQYRFTSGNLEWIRDRNGNATTFQQITGPDPTVYSFAVTDPLGRTTEVKKGYRWIVDPNDESVNGYYDEIKFKGAEGQDRFVRVYRRDYWPDALCNGAPCGAKKTSWDLFGPLGSDTPVYVNSVSKIELPDGRAYEFTYNEYAEIIRISLPTGGAYEYSWDNGDPATGPVIQTNPGSNLAAVYRRVVERREYASAGSLSRRSTYTPSYYNQNGSLGDPLESSPYRCAESWCTEVTATEAGVGPISAEEVLAVVRHTFYGSAKESLFPGTFQYSTWTEGKEFRTSWETAAGGVVRQEIQLWQQRATPSWWTGANVPPPQGPEPALDPRVIRSDRRVEDGRVARTEFNYASDSSNNQTDVWEHEYGDTSGSPGPVLRYTHTDYVTSPAYVSADTGVHLRSLPLRKFVCGPWANCTENPSAAKTEYGYDEADLAPLTSRSNPTGHDASFGTSWTTRGNLTSVRVWRNTPAAGWLITRAAYDTLGNITAIQDPNGAADGSRTSIGYQDCFTTGAPPSGQTFAFRTTVQNPLGWSNSACYDYHIGRATTFTDVNNVTTSIMYGRAPDGSGWDNLDRVRQITRASGLGATFEQRTAFAYSDTPGAISLTTTSDQLVTSDQRLKTVTFFDGFGRKVQSTLYETDTTGIQTDTQYDGLGRALRVSNPYRSGSPLWTTTTYDPVGRVKRVEYPDGSAVTTLYNGQLASAWDEVGNQRDLTSDALGRLTQVIEDPGEGEEKLNYVTAYGYDQLDNLTSVTQGAQPSRTFVYDTVGRLLSATNPESGTTQYTYDDNSNLKTKTDARNFVTTLDYDRLDRLTYRQQPKEPNGQEIAWLCYDGLSAGSNGCGGSQSFKGALSGTWSAASSTTYTRDALLRATASTQATDPYTGGFTYYYNVDGTITSMTYPSASTVTYAYDRAGRPNAVSRGTESIASSVLYAPHGAVESLTLGNGLFERVLYNNRLQPYQMNLGTSSGSGNVWSLVNTYGDPGANNGNVLEQLITAPGADAARQVYKYDHVNRLKLFTEKATNVDAWTCQAAAAPLCEEFGYDQWGNRRIVDRSGVGPSLSEPGEFSSATNRITTAGFTYDGGVPGPGNLTATPAGAFAYDAENRMISATTALGTTQYSYDAEGRRVKKVEGTTATVYVYDAAGQLAAEYGGTAPASTTRAYLTQDHLGSTRVVTNKEGTEVVERRDYMPFGEEIAAPEGSWRLSVPGYMNAAATTLKFTGKERDAETGLDYFGARYLWAAQGRFTSADPDGVDQHPEDPQSWNLYTYARNNPLGFVDVSGRYVCASNVSKEQCDNFQASLEAAQAQANRLAQKYGADSKQYKDAQRAIDIYGKKDVANGVTVKIGDTGGWGGLTEVAGSAGEKTPDNPTGQQISITFGADKFKGSRDVAMDIVHEGSHAADGRDWVRSGFLAAMNPTKYETEFRAFSTHMNVAGSMGYPSLLYIYPGTRNRPGGWNIVHVGILQNFDIQQVLRRGYRLAPTDRVRAFKRNTRAK